MNKTEEFIYNAVDFGITLLLIFISSPVFIFACLLVKLDSAGPIFYSQERYGKNRRKFWIYKFRTMKVNSESSGPVWGEESDPRSSRIGKLLRVSHIDELPQLFNIIKGQMSLVGPRPERPYFAEIFEVMLPGYEKRYLTRPGLTGWAQINGLRGDSSVEKRLDFDLYYIRNNSLLFYLKVILLTPLAKPVEKNIEAVIEYDQPLVFSQDEEVLVGNIPFIVPIRNA